MPHKLLAEYLSQIELAVQACNTAYVERYIEEILTPNRANLRIRLRFKQDYLLEINCMTPIFPGAIASFLCLIARLPCPVRVCLDNTAIFLDAIAISLCIRAILLCIGAIFL